MIIGIVNDYDWKFWRYRDEVDALFCGAAIGIVLCGLLAGALVLL